MSHRQHHTRDTHEFEIGIPISFDGQPAEWSTSKGWRDRVPIMPPFGYNGDVDVLVTGVQGALIGLSAINATFSSELIGDRYATRMILGGAEEVAHIHARILSVLDGLNKLSTPEQGLVSHRNGRLVGAGAFRACVLRPDPTAPYNIEVHLDTVVLARDIDAKGASEPVAEFRLL